MRKSRKISTTVCQPISKTRKQNTMTEKFEDNQEEYLNNSFYQNGFLDPEQH